MLYAIQSDVLSFLRSNRLRDEDGFASEFAQLYVVEGRTEQLLKKALAMRTVTFSPRRRERRILTLELIERVDRKFRRGVNTIPKAMAPPPKERERLLALAARVRRKDGDSAFRELLSGFKAAVEADGIEPFWVSRRREQLRPRPEQIAQLCLMMYLKEPMRRLRGFALREVRSGVGYIDVMAVFGRSRRCVVELKIRSGDRLVGATQLASYVGTQGLKRGWLLVLDSRANRETSDSIINVGETRIDVVGIDINPIAPSARQPVHKRPASDGQGLYVSRPSSNLGVELPESGTNTPVKFDVT